MSADQSLGRFSAVPMQVRVETGPSKVKVRQILEWKPGTLFTSSQEPKAGLHLNVGGVLVAHGELLLRRGRAGFQIAAFANPAEPERAASGAKD